MKWKFWEKEQGKRHVFVNDVESNREQKFCNNKVATYKYNIITWIPKNILEQFMRIANLYFLLVSILQISLSRLSPTGSYSTALPLALVMAFQLLKDGYEDWLRHIEDRKVNNTKTHVLRDEEIHRVRWRDVRVGDIVYVKNKEAFPCDLALLSSSDPQGKVYVETSSLDGETNLKMKKGLSETAEYDQEHLSTWNGYIECEAPNNSLYTFMGNLFLDRHYSDSKPLSTDQILLRGSTLRNTDYAYALAIYTGHDTKLMKNQNDPPHKRSKVERLTNKMILLIFATMLTLVTVCSIAATVFTSNASHWYLIFPSNLGRVFFEYMVTFFILFNNFIPISLYVSMEFCKIFQAKFIDYDVEMYDREHDVAAVHRTSSLNEELGTVEYVFSDKTGTLTQNLMEFMKFSVNGQPFGRGLTEIGRAAAMRRGEAAEDDRPEDYPGKTTGFAFYDPRISGGAWKKREDAESVERFLRLLALCHTVVTEMDGEGKATYSASSPDEGALVIAAKQLGYEFVKSTDKSMTIKKEDESKEEEVELLEVLEFNSTRKRMSVIVRESNGDIVLYTKGADAVLFPLMRPNQKYIEETTENLKNFANEGLRTLICASTVLNPDHFHAWQKRCHEARSIVGKERDQKVMEVYAEIEQDLELVGATAIEDKLQEGVPETIAELAMAKVKVWVLTGDKEETAINIGYACSLLTTDMNVVVLRDTEDVHTMGERIYEAHQEAQSRNSNQEPCGVVVDGKALTTIMNEPEIRMRFLRLGMLCQAVVCCRVTPLQKSQVVELVKHNLDTITLAIGDGANDVSMIQASHIGIGISGREGLQASRAADYAIGQFRFLKRLLFVHGRWNYRRTSKLIIYFLYKNIILQLVQFFFFFFNGFSGTTQFSSYVLPMWNVLFTIAPVLVFGIFDRDVSAKTCEAFPELYMQGLTDKFFNVKVFGKRMLLTLAHAVIAYFVPYLCIWFSSNGSGHPLDDIHHFGNIMMTICCTVVTLKIGLESCSWTWIHFTIFILSIISVPIYTLLLGIAWLVFRNITVFGLDQSLGSLSSYYMIPVQLFGSHIYWFSIVLTVAMCLLPDFAYKFWMRNYSRDLYFAIIKADAGKGHVEREYLLDNFPILRHPQEKKIRKPNRIQKKVSQLFKIFSESEFGTGYAFSQQESNNNQQQDDQEQSSSRLNHTKQEPKQEYNSDAQQKEETLEMEDFESAKDESAKDEQQPLAESPRDPPLQ
eukprot:gb/GECH01000391.1/.p1 GENE.gb/GECH01000391.1/~~gb/GECH01000391.1/.p1  ORF type:complete len:1222 (+),score=292.51 gb/GECH01000391.1/:1-3666(+)